MRITKWGEFGILCSLYLASKHNQQSSVGASEIAETQGIPLQYTQQILQRLRKGNIIESVRGPKGGYRIAQAPEAISLKHVMYAAEGDTFEVICDTNPVHLEQCSTEHQCGLRSVWRDLKTTVDEFLASRTLADVLKDHEFIAARNNSSNSQGLVAPPRKACVDSVETE